MTNKIGSIELYDCPNGAFFGKGGDINEIGKIIAVRTANPVHFEGESVAQRVGFPANTPVSEVADALNALRQIAGRPEEEQSAILESTPLWKRVSKAGYTTASFLASLATIAAQVS